MADIFDHFLAVFYKRSSSDHWPSLHIDKVIDPVSLPVISTKLFCCKLHKLDSYKPPVLNHLVLMGGFPGLSLKETAD